MPDPQRILPSHGFAAAVERSTATPGPGAAIVAISRDDTGDQPVFGLTLRHAGGETLTAWLSLPAVDRLADLILAAIELGEASVARTRTLQ